MPRPGSPRRRIAPAAIPMDHAWSEDDLQREVLGACRQLDLLAYHTHDSRRSQPGYPDLTIAGRGGVLFVELKSATGRLEPAQIAWRDRLLEGGQQWRLWRPADWFGQTIAIELGQLRRGAWVPFGPPAWAPDLKMPRPANYCGPQCAEGHTYLWGECELAVDAGRIR